MVSETTLFESIPPVRLSRSRSADSLFRTPHKDVGNYGRFRIGPSLLLPGPVTRYCSRFDPGVGSAFRKLHTNPTSTPSTYSSFSVVSSGTGPNVHGTPLLRHLVSKTGVTEVVSFGHGVSRRGPGTPYTKSSSLSSSESQR